MAIVLDICHLYFLQDTTSMSTNGIIVFVVVFEPIVNATNRRAMYDKRLDAVIKSAELGSFSKAAHEMGYSIPALIKQVNGFESQTGVTVFERSNKGIELTPSGRAFIEDAKDIIARCNQAIDKAHRNQAQAANLVRVGISLYQSGQPILELCQKMFVNGTDLSIQFIPVADTYESYKRTIEHFGEDIDVLTSTRLPEEDERNCNLEILGNPFICLMVPLHDELAKYDTVDVSFLSGRRIHVPARGNTYIDSARLEIAEGASGVEFIEFPFYTMEIFDTCANQGDILLSKEIWRDVYPLLKTVNVNWSRTIPYCLYYAKNPRPAVMRFVEDVKALV